jgi:hypothetical protein
MSITPHFVADPPQWIKRRFFTYTDTYIWELNDVVGWLDGSGGVTADTLTYKCTTAGTGSGVFNPASAATYTWGTSEWTKITSSSWANACPIGRKDLINYVDCNATKASSNRGAAIIYVEPSTMRPRVGRKIITPGGGSLQYPSDGYHGPTFFGPIGYTHYHTRPRFGETVTVSATVIDGVDLTGDVPSVSSIDTENARGLTLNITGSGTRSVTTTGVAITQTITGGAVPSVAALSINLQDLERRFGVHVNHNEGSTIFGGMTGTYSYAGQYLYRSPDAFISDNSFTPPNPSMRGSLCTIQRTPATYRDGAAGSDPVFSLLFGGMTNANYGSLWMSPFIYLHNTLTGSRTVTIHFLTDSPRETDINDTDIWFECFYPSSNTTPKYSLASNENANVGVPACTKTAVPTDAATWTAPTIYFTTAFKLNLTMTIQRAGILMLRVNVASMKLSRHVLYMCPYIDVV